MGTFDSTNKWYRFGAGQGLELNMFNCINKGTAYTIYMRVSLDSLNGWRRLLTSEGWSENGVRIPPFVFIPDSGITDVMCSPALCQVSVPDLP
jgi:hypothetical protein